MRIAVAGDHAGYDLKQAAVGWIRELGHQVVDMNVLCLGGRVVGVALAQELVESFLDAKFTGEERHVRRLNKVRAIEEQFPGKAQTARPR
jgi:ribose 5-phosphate isomerase RpiB